MANRGYPLPVQVRSYRSSRRRSKSARDFRRVSMIVPQLSANDTFDLGDGLMRPDPYIMEPGRVDVAAYTSDDRFADERALFGRIWLLLGRVEHLPSLGDWTVRRIHIRGAAALIVRGQGNTHRTSHKTCPHSGMDQRRGEWREG